MSKQRALARAQREAAALRRSEQQRAAREKAAARRARHDRRDLTWRRLRLWQHGHAFQRKRETLGALFSVMLAALLLVYLFTGSMTDVLVTLLVLLVVGPVLALLSFDRRSS